MWQKKPFLKGLFSVQGWARMWVPGLVDSSPTVAYHFCLDLPETFPQSQAHFFSPALYLQETPKQNSNK